MTLSAPRRYLYLDVLRGLAIVLVLLRHPPVRVTDGDALAPLFRALYLSGWCGVDLFFTLSGFLIGGLLFDEYTKRGSIDLKRFWIRRAFKILPPYWAYMAIGFAAAIALTPGSITARLGEAWEAHAASLAFLQNYTVLRYTHTWSLAVEEHFYILLPIALGLLLFSARRRADDSRDPFRILPMLYLAVALSCLAGRLLMENVGLPFNIYRQYVVTHLRLDSLLAGACLAYVVRFKPDCVEHLRPLRWPILLASVGCFMPTFFWEMEPAAFMHTWAFTLLQLGSCGLILFGAMGQPMMHPPQIARTTARIGQWSYAMYLWHAPVSMAGTKVLFDVLGMPTGGWMYPVMIATYIGVGVLVGAIFTQLIETPSLKLRERLFPAKKAPAPVMQTHAPVRLAA